MKDFEHLSDAELKNQLDEDEVLSRKAYDEARVAEGIWRGKMMSYSIIRDRVNDQANELIRRRRNNV